MTAAEMKKRLAEIEEEIEERETRLATDFSLGWARLYRESIDRLDTERRSLVARLKGAA